MEWAISVATGGCEPSRAPEGQSAAEEHNSGCHGRGRGQATAGRRSSRPTAASRSVSVPTTGAPVSPPPSGSRGLSEGGHGGSGGRPVPARGCTLVAASGAGAASPSAPPPAGSAAASARAFAAGSEAGAERPSQQHLLETAVKVHAAKLHDHVEELLSLLPGAVCALLKRQGALYSQLQGTPPLQTVQAAALAAVEGVPAQLLRAKAAVSVAALPAAELPAQAQSCADASLAPQQRAKLAMLAQEALQGAVQLVKDVSTALQEVRLVLLAAPRQAGTSKLLPALEVEVQELRDAVATVEDIALGCINLAEAASNVTQLVDGRADALAAALFKCAVAQVAPSPPYSGYEAAAGALEADVRAECVTASPPAIWDRLRLYHAALPAVLPTVGELREATYEPHPRDTAPGIIVRPTRVYLTVLGKGHTVHMAPSDSLGFSQHTAESLVSMLLRCPGLALSFARAGLGSTASKQLIILDAPSAASSATPLAGTDDSGKPVPAVSDMIVWSSTGSALVHLEWTRFTPKAQPPPYASS